MAVQRFDVGRLDRAKRTGAGGARVPMSLSRTGVQTYTDDKGNTVREYRSPEEVFAAESLASLASVPITVGHPREGVTPKNYRSVSVGITTDNAPSRRPEGAVEWVDTAGIVNDAPTLERVDTGDLAEVSAGYTADVIPKKGVAPDGQPYDALQTNIRFNHVALLPPGHARAGSGAKLRLDGNQEPTMFVRHDDNSSTAQSPKVTVKVDGIDVEKGSDTHLSLLERQVTTQTKRADEAETALKAAQTAQGELQAKLGEAQKKLDAIDVNKLVQDELDFRSRLLPILPKTAAGKPYDFTGKTREQVRADAVGSAVVTEAQKLGSDAERAGFITAHINMKLDAAGKPPAARTPLHTPTAETRDDSSESPSEQKPPKFRDKRADAFKESFGAQAGAK